MQSPCRRGGEGEGMTPRLSKLGMALDIVDWEHRYKFRRLMGGDWCLRRISELMKLSRAEVWTIYDFTFNDGIDAEPITFSTAE